MIEDGYRPTTSGSMTSAAMAFMRDHGVLKDIYSESTGTAHKTAKGTKVSVRTVKAPGFGPKVLRCIPAVHDLPQAQRHRRQCPAAV